MLLRSLRHFQSPGYQVSSIPFWYEMTVNPYVSLMSGDHPPGSVRIAFEASERPTLTDSGEMRETIVLGIAAPVSSGVRR